MDKKTIGKSAEDFACEYLKKKNYTIIERNWSCHGGEIDIIAKDGDELVFGEVRCKKKSSPIRPIDTITYSKQMRIQRAIEQYIYDNKLEMLARCDIICVAYEMSKGQVFFSVEEHILRVDFE